MLAEVKEEKRELKRRVDLLTTELDLSKEALSIETLHRQKQTADNLQLQAELDKLRKQLCMDT